MVSSAEPERKGSVNTEVLPGNGIGVGFIGAGNVLWAYLQTLDHLGPRGLVWEGPVCARDRSRWPGLHARRPGMTLVDTPEAVLDSDVDVVVILTAPSTHAELSEAALRRGKHVVCEKPVGCSMAEAAPIFELASAAGLHVMAAPFVQLSPTMRELWTRVNDGEIGAIHSARALYGNRGAPWADWFRRGEVGPLVEVGIYNLKSLTALLGPAVEVYAAEASIGGGDRNPQAPDAVQVVLRHTGGAVSTITASHRMSRYRRPAIELYGTEGTANLLGDDWDPTGIELWRDDQGAWTTYDSRDPTWTWTDGLRELAEALSRNRAPLADADHDLHLIDILDRAAESASHGRPMPVESTHRPPDLRIDLAHDPGRIHDHTRPPGDQ